MPHFSTQTVNSITTTDIHHGQTHSQGRETPQRYALVPLRGVTRKNGCLILYQELTKSGIQQDCSIGKK